MRDNDFIFKGHDPRTEVLRRHGRGGYGPGVGPDFEGADAGFGGPRGHRGPGGRGPGGRGGRGRARGDIRAAVLVLLAEQERHGYDLIRAIEERTQGAWAPSPGSIYPTLQSLQDEGLVTIDVSEGRKVASLTDEGRAWVADNVPTPAALFAQPEGGAGIGQVRHEMVQLRDAAMHVTRQVAADEDQVAKVAAVLASARKDLYRLLAEQD
ncbi:PadR family transcriptional regulator [Demequina sp. NBRC 110057]|uniref:PadR family transcriptional regulator n=1 Tax=Demequina sp. NBRC 110057 TaxID=1570346 RepID=UPI0011773B93|nr:PadR family transcriptional regulator [Demequina sp. NBRC 110057]